MKSIFSVLLLSVVKTNSTPSCRSSWPCRIFILHIFNFLQLHFLFIFTDFVRFTPWNNRRQKNILWTHIWSARPDLHRRTYWLSLFINSATFPNIDSVGGGFRRITTTLSYKKHTGLYGRIQGCVGSRVMSEIIEKDVAGLHRYSAN